MDREYDYDDDFDPIQDRFDNEDNYNKYDEYRREI